MKSPADWRDLLAEALPEISGDRRRDAEILDELAQHCADRAADLADAGMAASAIRARVLDEVRDLLRHRRALRGAVPAAAPASWSVGRFPAAFTGVWHDLRYAARLLVRAPGFAAVALLTLVLAIGGATTIFSVVQAVLLRPLPYPAQDRLVYVWEVTPRGVIRNIVAAGNYFDWRERATSFVAMGAMTSPFGVALTGAREPRRIRAARVSSSVFDVFQPQMLYGHRFEAAEDVSGGPAVAVLTYAFWRDQFGASPHVIGQPLVVDGVPTTIVGVLPPTVDFSLLGADMVVPMRLADAERQERRSHNYYVVARLQDGATVASANVEMATIVRSLTTLYPKDLTGWGSHVAGMRDDNVRTVRPMLQVLMAVALLVLVIACANLANLQLVRATRRRGELAIRAAIGAGFTRLARQLVIEALLLCTLGGLLAVTAVALTLPALVAAAPGSIPYLTDARLDGEVLVFALVATAACSLLVGMTPAAMLWRADLQPLLHSSRVPAGSRHRHLRHVLVAVQVGLALVLIVCASLLVKSMWRVYAVDFGFVPDRVMSVRVDLPASRYSSNEMQRRFFDDVQARVRVIPGVTHVAGATGEFGTGSGMTFSFAIAGRVSTNPSGREDPVPLQAVTPGYFETMKIPLRAGRTLTETDRADAPAVVVVNQTLAARLFPSGDAVGQRIIFRQGQLPWREVVGVVGDTRDEGLDRDAPPMLYLPYAQKQENWRWMSWQTLVVRTAGDPLQALPGIRQAVRAIDADLPLIDARPVVAAYAAQLSQRRFAMQMLVAGASLALVLGAIGIYGVLACAVAERRREIGIRRALGASAAHVVGAVVRSAVVFAAVGAIGGIVVALVVTRFLATLLYRVEPRDPATFAAAAAVLVAVATVAAWIPARRALRVDPIETMRSE